MKFGMHFFCPKPAENSVLETMINMKRNSMSLLDAIENIQNEIDKKVECKCTTPSVIQKKDFEKYEKFSVKEKKVIFTNRQVMIATPRTVCDQPKTPGHIMFA